ncbi:hypothetical protein PIGHUM_03727 [Pigmentiphaga humi]|uniref:Periplasmic protein n=1 Tax=Pigmentiphaga humi TaxID=2478468 RepID=A0A3P4B6U3_9BURK|nr:Spy/CpxP family protein refolding chaperone [Pigmentiphaga humi]VCU71641.1 hypothetical protein PIGHUM_03727 [Pigmentiphaga humi]
MKTTKNTLRTMALALVLATGGAGVLQAAHAQAPAEPPPAPQAGQSVAPPAPRAEGHRFKHPPRAAMHHRAFAGPMAESPMFMLGHLKSRLGLNESQQKLWDKARDLSREAGQAMRAQRGEDVKALRAQAEAGPLDLRALAAKRDASRNAIKPKLDASRDAWLAAYDSLDGKQKQIVADSVKKRFERQERKADKHRQVPRSAQPAAPATN